jgi:hypothetical protein
MNFIMFVYIFCKNFNVFNNPTSRPGSAVGIATAYGLDGPEIETRWGQGFPNLSRPALRPSQPPVQWVPALSGSKVWPGRDADPSSLLVPR